ncbi:MAG TPA: hypothetical protein V6D28_08440 [Leptolyngbyaceae cyanobacterium]
MTDPVFMPPQFPLMYRAVGQVRGCFIPTIKKVTKGVLLTDDGILIPAKLVAKAGMIGKTQPEIIQGEKIWSVYPHTEVASWFEKIIPFLPDREEVAAIETKSLPPLWVEIRDLREPKAPKTIEELLQSNNYFSIRGLIIKQDEQQGKLTIRIHRNKIPPGKEKQSQYQPLNLIIDGFLPGKVEGQFWDLDVSREGDILIVDNGTFVADLSPPEPDPPPSAKKQVKSKGEAKQDKKDPSQPNKQPKKTGKIIRLV